MIITIIGAPTIKIDHSIIQVYYKENDKKRYKNEYLQK